MISSELIIVGLPRETLRRDDIRLLHRLGQRARHRT